MGAFVVALVALGSAVASLTDGTEGLLAEDIRQQVNSIGRRALTFQDILIDVDTVGRVELTQSVDDVIESIDSAYEYLDGLEDPPAEATGIIVLYRLSLESWEQGVTDLRDALLAAADGEADAAGVTPVVESLLRLQAGDRLYEQLVAEIARTDISQPVAAMPNLRFVPTGYPLAAGASALLNSASADGSSLELRSELAIGQVTTEPEWVLDIDDNLVVDPVDELVFRIVVTNDGNASSDPTEMTIEMVGVDGNVQNQTMPVPAIAAGSRTTVVFDPVSVSVGASYQVLVTLPTVAGENAEDNIREARFRVNEPPPPDEDDGEEDSDSG